MACLKVVSCASFLGLAWPYLCDLFLHIYIFWVDRLQDLINIFSKCHERAYFLVGGYEAHIRNNVRDQETLDAVHSLQKRVYKATNQETGLTGYCSYTEKLEKVLGEKGLTFGDLAHLSVRELKSIKRIVNRRAQSSAAYHLRTLRRSLPQD